MCHLCRVDMMQNVMTYAKKACRMVRTTRPVCTSWASIEEPGRQQPGWRQADHPSSSDSTDHKRFWKEFGRLRPSLGWLSRVRFVLPTGPGSCCGRSPSGVARRAIRRARAQRAILTVIFALLSVVAWEVDGL